MRRLATKTRVALLIGLSLCGLFSAPLVTLADEIVARIAQSINAFALPENQSTGFRRAAIAPASIWYLLAFEAQQRPIRSPSDLPLEIRQQGLTADLAEESRKRLADEISMNGMLPRDAGCLIRSALRDAGVSLNLAVWTSTRGSFSGEDKAALRANLCAVIASDRLFQDGSDDGTLDDWAREQTGSLISKLSRAGAWSSHYAHNNALNAVTATYFVSPIAAESRTLKLSSGVFGTKITTKAGQRVYLFTGTTANLRALLNTKDTAEWSLLKSRLSQAQNAPKKIDIDVESLGYFDPAQATIYGLIVQHDLYGSVAQSRLVLRGGSVKFAAVAQVHGNVTKSEIEGAHSQAHEPSNLAYVIEDGNTGLVLGTGGAAAMNNPQHETLNPTPASALVAVKHCVVLASKPEVYETRSSQKVIHHLYRAAVPSLLKITFRNLGPQPLHNVSFDVARGGDKWLASDAGTFEQGVDISHILDLRPERLLTSDTAATCTVNSAL